MDKVKLPQKILVAMSGGVDSGVAAALLKRQGFDTFGKLSVNPEQSRRVDVAGVFLRLHNCPQFRDGEKSAKKIAKLLGIPFFVLDLRKEFKKKVIDYFLKEIKKARTPNPCVVCNKEVKLGLLLKEAKKKGFDFIATGHYIKKRKAKSAKRKAATQNSKLFYRLFQARDNEKDQSYFLWTLSQKQLKHILFPLGDYTKDEVRNLAKKFGISKFIRSESQEICFVQNGLDKFLKKHLRPKSGKIVDVKGKVIGEHQGLCFYTIGQRSGIGLGGGAPYYVLGKDLKKNILIVTRQKKDLDKKELIAKKVNWISGKAPKLPLSIKAKIRYRHKSSSAVITKNLKPKTYNLKFNRSQRAITPGQSVVFYSGQQLLGGGVID